MPDEMVSYLTACAVSSVPEIIMSRNYDETLLTSDGETFGTLPPMPISDVYLHDHCAVALEGGDLFVAGGWIQGSECFELGPNSLLPAATAFYCC